MQFRSYDALRTFDVVARHLSMTVAGQELHQSKGAVSYQIKKLEDELGFPLFERANARLELTDAGRRLWHVSQSALVQIDKEIVALRGHSADTVTVGVLTYFASRWLSPRLTRFFETHLGVGLRIEPITGIDSLASVNVDLAIVWGVDERMYDKSELLLACPAVPTANPEIAERINNMGLAQATTCIPLFGDSSGDAGWQAWHAAANLPYQPSHNSLTILDSNTRVQAVIDGQGLGLWDELVTPELDAGTLVHVSEIRLENAGYFVVYPDGVRSAAAAMFVEWLKGLRGKGLRGRRDFGVEGLRGRASATY